MKRIATILFAASCFALLNSPARAVELLVIVLPEDAIRGVDRAWEAANQAQYSMWGARDAAARVNAQQFLAAAKGYMEVSEKFLQRANENVAIIAILHPRDPLSQQQEEEFYYNTAVAHAYMSAAMQLVYSAYCQYDPIVRYYCAPAVSAAHEAVSRTGRLQNQSIEDVLDGLLGLDPLML